MKRIFFISEFDCYNQLGAIKKFWKPHTISTLLYKCIKLDCEALPWWFGLSKSNRSNHILQQAGKSPFNLPLLMKFHSLLSFAGGMRWFLVFSNCHHFIQEHTTPVRKLALHNPAYKVPRTLQLKLQKKLLSSRHTKTFFHNCKDFFNSFIYGQLFLQRFFWILEKSL